MANQFEYFPPKFRKLKYGSRIVRPQTSRSQEQCARYCRAVQSYSLFRLSIDFGLLMRRTATIIFLVTISCYISKALYYD